MSNFPEFDSSLMVAAQKGQPWLFQLSEESWETPQNVQLWKDESIFRGCEWNTVWSVPPSPTESSSKQCRNMGVALNAKDEALLLVAEVDVKGP